MAVTVRDVAKAAGVSPSTVSRVFTAPEQVQTSTRDKVIEVASRLGYRPDPTARSLRSGRTESLGLVIPDIANPFFPPIVKAMQTRARTHGHTLLVADCDEREADELETIEAIVKKVDGLVLWASTLSDGRLRELAEEIPLVLVNRHVPGIPELHVSLAPGVTQAAEHLRALGHTSCVFVNCSRPEHLRGKAIRETFDAQGLGLVELGPYDPRFETGLHAATLAIANGATAILAHNDLVAVGVLHGLTAAGVDVPGEVSVIGIDDTLLAGLSIPALTTIRISPQAVATHATDLIVETITGSATAQHLVEVGSRLIPRASTGPAPHRA
ncbi:LacI family transcriptional regulator [Kribbella amoyensis]|uniref:LacI family transcriptional regulator n=1 Tax=Kribbella amoyensis TaxID=996641 RepID=A0A561BMX7_9ACTN|nr:LacI family DNA-binding transcriptional regulator [Kribbella amoyensis]TWD80209.1 LacI family transcriptional regulator [Kribbella amoyensis]